jgi:hypothetical protein
MTQDEKKKIYTALSAPFPEEAIERTDGRVTGLPGWLAGAGSYREPDHPSILRWRAHERGGVRWSRRWMGGSLLL